ncbi:MAG TPA: hypothetical protein VLZ84_09940 [Asticcacaulis sp.]|nr:hypothetical protein [Asticcacaulis sp.]
MADMIRYFGNDVVYGPDCEVLPDNAELIVEVVGGLFEHITVAMMIDYADSAAYPVAYQLAEAA